MISWNFLSEKCGLSEVAFLPTWATGRAPSRLLHVHPQLTGPFLEITLSLNCPYNWWFKWLCNFFGMQISLSCWWSYNIQWISGTKIIHHITNILLRRSIMSIIKWTKRSKFRERNFDFETKFPQFGSVV